MPTNLPPGLVLAAICKRENPEDAVIIHPRHKKQVGTIYESTVGVLTRSLGTKHFELPASRLGGWNKLFTP